MPKVKKDGSSGNGAAISSQKAQNIRRNTLKGNTKFPKETKFTKRF